MRKIALEIIHRGTSPTPIGLTPGHLLSGIWREATKAVRPCGFTRLVAIRRPTSARAIQRLLETDLKEEQSLLQASASKPDGPAAPWVCIAAWCMNQHPNCQTKPG